MIEEIAAWAAAFKPNMACFEVMGIDGIRVLEELLALIPDEVPVILDLSASRKPAYPLASKSFGAGVERVVRQHVCRAP